MGNGRQRRVVLILLYIALFLLLVLGALLIIRPGLIEGRRRSAVDSLLVDAMDGKTQVAVDSGALKVYGEETDQEVLSPVFSYDDSALSKLDGNTTLQILGIIEIDRIQLRLPVLEGVGRVPLRYGAGRYPQSGHIGDPGVCALFGHRMYEYGNLFNRMDEVQEGDLIAVSTVDQLRYIYEVSHVSIVEPQALLKELNQPVEGSYIALVTCHPVRIASHRMVVWAKLTDIDITEETK